MNAVEEKAAKYDPRASAHWALLIYVNVPWADCLSWADAKAGLVALSPPFARIEIVFDVGTGALTDTVWRRPG
jgi:hypothetical protein